MNRLIKLKLEMIELMKIFKTFNLVFILFMALSNVCSIHDCRYVYNDLFIEIIKSEIKSKGTDLGYYYGYGGCVFALNKVNNREFFVFLPVYDKDRTKFEGEVIFKFTSEIKNTEAMLLSLTLLNMVKGINLKASDFSCILSIKDRMKFVTLPCMENHCLKKHCPFNIKMREDGRVYYTVPSEDKLDDIHMVYESGNERKEFVFTNLPEKPIVPVEEVEKLGKKPEIKPKKTIMSQIFNLFGFSTKHEEVKNEGYDCDNEKTRLKEKIY